MNILILNGSPLRDRSTTMCATRAFVKGITESCECSVETIHVADLNIKPCLGCLSCWGRTEGECVIKDDIQMVKEKILAADIIIESFPIYFFGLPGPLKTLTDRMLSMVMNYSGQSAPQDGEPAHKLRYYNPAQKFVLISGCAFTETEKIYDPLRKQFDLICGERNYTALFIPQLEPLVNQGGSRKERFEARVLKAGKEFASNGSLSEDTIKSVTKPSFTKPVYELIIRNVFANAQKEKKDCQT